MCENCFDNCAPSITDKCVKYMGEDIPLLGICEGNSLSMVEEAVITALLSSLDGTGITPKDVTLENCPELKTLLAAKSPTLANLLQLLIDNQCTLKGLIKDLTDDSIFVFDKKCLTITGDVNSDSILQAAVNLLCSINTTINTFSTTYVKTSDLPTQVINIITGANGNAPAQYNSRLFPNAPTLYIGSLSNFDNTGKGITASGFEKVYIMNGLNGTLDWRGRVGMGASRNVPGGTFDAAVDPNNPLNPNTNFAIGDKAGEFFHKLTPSEGPVHNHSVTQTPHSHNIKQYLNDTGISRQDNGLYDKADNDSVPIVRTTEPSTIDISVSPSVGGQAHNNIQPSAVGVWIVYIP